MDLDPEKIHDALTEVGLPSTLAELKNPTEEYVINLLTQFLSAFNIDVAAIVKLTPQQLGFEVANDNADLISLINLAEVMANISDQLFLKDFYLTDLTSPAPKKNRRLAKVLSNFLLYALNKIIVIEKRFEEIRHKLRQLEDTDQERTRYMEIKNKKALENAKKMALATQLEAEIARIKSSKAGKEARNAELQEILKNVQKEKIESEQLHGNLTAEATRMRKKTEDLEAKLVGSPELYQSRLKELVEQKTNLEEKRKVMEEAMTSKKPAIERIQSHLSVVSDAHAKLSETIEVCKNLTQSKKTADEIMKKVSEMNSLIKQETTMPMEENSEVCNELLQRTKDQEEQNLSSIRNVLAELSNKKKSLERKLAEDQTRQQEKYSERDEIRVSIETVEAENKEFVAQCQELYDNEINQERRLKSSLEIRKM